MQASYFMEPRVAAESDENLTFAQNHTDEQAAVLGLQIMPVWRKASD